MYICIMKRNLKPSYDVKDLGVNHFTDNLIIPTNVLVIPNTYTKDSNGDLLNKTGDIEVNIFTKMYVGAERRLLINKLTTRSKELYLWLMFEITSGEDQIWINKYRYMNENKVNSLTTYKDAIKDLIKNSILKKTKVQDVYFINPDFFFKGNRINKYPNKLKRKDITGD